MLCLRRRLARYAHSCCAASVFQLPDVDVSMIRFFVMMLIVTPLLLPPYLCCHVTLSAAVFAATVTLIAAHAAIVAGTTLFTLAAIFR